MSKKLYTIIILSLVYITANAQAPNWVWANGAGGTNHDNANCTTTDASGNVYVVGRYVSPSITIGTDTFTQASINPAYGDMFIIKYDAGGNIFWAKSVGSAYADIAVSVVTDFTGNVYVVGSFSSPSLTFGTITISSAGQSDIFIVEYDPLGNVIWAKSAGGSGNDEVTDCVIDTFGNLYITGGSYAPFTFGTDSLDNVGSKDMFIIKYDASGNEIWAMGAGSTGSDYGNGITTDPSGNVFVSGYYTSSIIFGADTLSDITSGTFYGNIFILKYDSSGTILWAKGLQTEGSSGGYTTADPLGNVYVTGWFSPDSIAFGSITLTNTVANGGCGVFIVKYDASGNVLWAKGMEDVGCSYGNMVTDNSGNLYVAGFFRNSFTIGGYTLTNVDSNEVNVDMNIIKYDDVGNVLWAKSAGSMGSDIIVSTCVDNSGDVYIAGYYGYVSFPSISFGATTLTNAGGSDMFIAKLGAISEGIREKNAGNEVTIYPNPSTGIFTFNKNIKTVEVFNLLGEVILSQGNAKEINLSAFPKGIYVARINGEYASKLVKE